MYQFKVIKEGLSLQEFVFKSANRLYTIESFTDAIKSLTYHQRQEISYISRSVRVNSARSLNAASNRPANPKKICGYREKDIIRYYRIGGTLSDIYKLFELGTVYSNYSDFYNYVRANRWLMDRLTTIDDKRDRSKKWKTIRSKLVKERNEYNRGK